MSNLRNQKEKKQIRESVLHKKEVRVRKERSEKGKMGKRQDEGIKASY